MRSIADERRMTSDGDTVRVQSRRKPRHAPNTLGDYVHRSLDAEGLLQEGATQYSSRHQRRRNRHRRRSRRDPDPSLSVCAQPVSNGTSGILSLASSSVVCGSTHLWQVTVDNLVVAGELEDSDEERDFASELRDDFGLNGSLVDVSVARDAGQVLLQFAHEADACAFVHARHGQVYGGRSLAACVLNRSDEDSTTQRQSTSSPHVRSGARGSNPASASQTPLLQSTVPLATGEKNKNQKKKRRSKIRNAVTKARSSGAFNQQIMPTTKATTESPSSFVITNLLLADEMDDDDEYDEIVSELTADLEKFGPLEHLHVVRHHGDAGDTQMKHVQSLSTKDDVPIGAVIVRFSSRTVAHSAFDAYHGKIFGGCKVFCEWTPDNLPHHPVFLSVDGFFESDELEDSDEYQDVHDETKTFLLQYEGMRNFKIVRASGKVIIEFGHEEQASLALRQFPSTLYGGRRLVATETGSDGIARIGLDCAEPIPSEVKPIKSVVHLVSDRMTELVTGFLKRLSSLQERAHERNSLMDKRARRLVLGLHEVRRGLLARKVKMLVIANDIEECQLLGSELDEIVSNALHQDVTTIYPMTRRKLGRILKKNVRVSCVGVYSYDGAEQSYHELVREAEKKKSISGITA